MTAHQPAKRAAGFTIVETLIVLAIAGLILLIVIQAIPALERNSRNNQRKQDAAAILQAVSHYELNYSGNVPACNGSYTNCAGEGKPLGDVKLTYYNQGASVINVAPSAAGSSPSSINDLETIEVTNYAKCDSASSANSSGAGYNDIVAIFAIETGSGLSDQCQQI